MNKYYCPGLFSNVGGVAECQPKGICFVFDLCVSSYHIWKVELCLNMVLNFSGTLLCKMTEAMKCLCATTGEGVERLWNAENKSPEEILWKIPECTTVLFVTQKSTSSNAPRI